MAHSAPGEPEFVIHQKGSAACGHRTVRRSTISVSERLVLRNSASPLILAKGRATGNCHDKCRARASRPKASFASDPGKAWGTPQVDLSVPRSRDGSLPGASDRLP